MKKREEGEKKRRGGDAQDCKRRHIFGVCVCGRLEIRPHHHTQQHGEESD